jgi:hypothetical protein
MKVVVVTVPMRPPDGIKAVIYPVKGDKTLEYVKPIRFPISSILANVFKKDEKVRVIFIMTTSENSDCLQNKQNIIKELEGINADIGAILSYDTVEIGFEATNKAYSKLIIDLADKIPDNAELYNDITYGFKTEVISLFCAFRFAEEYRNSVVQYIIYGKVEFKDNQPVNPELCDATSLYYLFKLMGKMGATDAESAMKILKDFFAL